MNDNMNKAAALIALLAVSLYAGCGNTAQTTTAQLSLAADDDISDDEVLLDDGEGEIEIDYGEVGEWGVEEDESIEDASGVDLEGEYEEAGEVSVTVPDNSKSGTADELIAKLQTNGQVIYSDEFCQIRYFGETKDDDGNLIYVLGYKKFHGGLIRFNKADFKLGSAVDFMYPLWFSPMNELTDGYLCMSGAHGAEFYENPADAWWKDNGFIYLCCPKAPGNEEEIWSSYSYRDCEFMKYDDSVYDSISTIGLYFGELVIQEGVSGDADGNAPHFDEPTDKNTHRCAVDLSSPVIRVRFDPGKVDFWAHT
jgi:hypothetical protein